MSPWGNRRAKMSIIQKWIKFQLEHLEWDSSCLAARWNDLYAFNMLNAQCAHACIDTWQLRFLFTKNWKTDLYSRTHFSVSTLIWMLGVFFHEFKNDTNQWRYRIEQNRTIWIGSTHMCSYVLWSKGMPCSARKEWNRSRILENIHGSYAFALGTTNQIQMFWCERCTFAGSMC